MSPTILPNGFCLPKRPYHHDFESLAAARINPPTASVHEGYLDAIPTWAFYGIKDGAMFSYAMLSEMKVAEARALRDAERGSQPTLSS